MKNSKKRSGSSLANELVHSLDVFRILTVFFNILPNIAFLRLHAFRCTSKYLKLIQGAFA